MPIPATAIGRTAGPRTVTVSARRSMAFAAATGDCNRRYFDDTGAELVAPPLLSVHLEWPLVVELRRALPGITPAEVSRGVHAMHDVTFHRLIRAGESVTTTGAIVGLERRPAGTAVLTRLDTIDQHGQPLITTYNGAVYREVELTGEPVSTDAPPPLPRPGADGGWSLAMIVPSDAAHIYTECAEIWNPIHTERSVALAAGLPGIILHGTATLGYAAQEIVNRNCGGDPSRLQRLAGRFGAMVLLDTSIGIAGGAGMAVPEGTAYGYRVTSAEGGPAIRNGVAIVRGG